MDLRGVDFLGRLFFKRVNVTLWWLFSKVILVLGRRWWFFIVNS